MKGSEIQEFLEQTLFALARAAGAGVDYMEPIVLMAKLRVHRTPDKDELYFWQQTLLLRVRKKRSPEGWTWTFFNGNDVVITTLFQERLKRG